MSRIGRKPIVIPTGVEVKIDGSNITVKGPKGTLDSKIHPMMTAKVENGEVVVTRPNDEKEARSLHGLTRTLISNMVEGVTNGFKKELEIQGVGYRAAKQGKNLVMNLGYSHQVIVPETDGITIDVPDPLKIVINGICLLYTSGRPGPVTPWGKPAMGYKTRKHHARSDKFIVKRATK